MNDKSKTMQDTQTHMESNHLTYPTDPVRGEQ
jgi:hypothetical protein